MAKADDLFGPKQTIFGAKADDLTKADDPKKNYFFDPKQTILAKADDPIFSFFYIPKQTILVRNSRTKPDDPGQNNLGPNRTTLGTRVRVNFG